MKPLIISLTTIPPRMAMIGPTLRALLAQTANVSEIRLNIARKYRRFDFDPATIPSYPEGIRVCLVDEDFGPATKVLPTVRAHAGEDVEILFCDDDQIYGPGWAQQFVDARAQVPDACIVETGRDLYVRDGHRTCSGVEAMLPRAARRKKDFRYRLYRALTLGRRLPPRYATPGYLDLFKGYRGAMIRPDFLPEATFEIPDVMWTHDDYWLSGQMAAHGVPIWCFAGKTPWTAPHGAARMSALLNWSYQGYGRKETSALMLRFFQDTHDLWRNADPR